MLKVFGGAKLIRTARLGVDMLLGDLLGEHTCLTASDVFVCDSDTTRGSAARLLCAGTILDYNTVNFCFQSFLVIVLFHSVDSAFSGLAPFSKMALFSAGKTFHFSCWTYFPMVCWICFALKNTAWPMVDSFCPDCFVCRKNFEHTFYEVAQKRLAYV